MKVKVFPYRNPGERGLHRAPFVSPTVDDDDKTDTGSVHAEEGGHAQEKIMKVHVCV